MSRLIKGEDNNPNEMNIHWKTMATIKTIAKTKTIAKAEIATRLTWMKLE